MYDKQYDRPLDNSGKGQYEEDGQNWDNTQTRSDRNDDVNANNPFSDQDKTGDTDRLRRESNPMESEEFDLSRLRTTPKNNDFSSMNGEMEEESDLDEDEEEDEEDMDDEDEDDLEEDDDENEDTTLGSYGDERTGMGDSQYQRRDGSRNEETKNPDEFINY